MVGILCPPTEVHRIDLTGAPTHAVFIPHPFQGHLSMTITGVTRARRGRADSHSGNTGRGGGPGGH